VPFCYPCSRLSDLSSGREAGRTTCRGDGRFLAGEAATAALFALAIKDGDETKMQEDLDYPVAFGLSTLGVLASDLLIMIIYEAAKSPSD
jgi:hypothetical protein